MFSMDLVVKQILFSILSMNFQQFLNEIQHSSIEKFTIIKKPSFLHRDFFFLNNRKATDSNP